MNPGNRTHSRSVTKNGIDVNITKPAVVTASAADDYPVGEMSDENVRIAILRIIADPDTGKAIQKTAQRAVDGTIGDRQTFLKTNLRLAQAEDDRVAIARILADPTINDAQRRRERAWTGTHRRRCGTSWK